LIGLGTTVKQAFYFKKKEKVNMEENEENVLRDDEFILVNKKLLPILGVKATIYLSVLISKEKYFFNRGLLVDNQFWNTQKDMEQLTLLSPKKQSGAIKILKANNLIEVERKGIPFKNYFKINHEKIFQILSLESPVKPQEIIRESKGRLLHRRNISKSLSAPKKTGWDESTSISQGKRTLFIREG